MQEHPRVLDDFYVEDTTASFRLAPKKVQREEYLSDLWDTKTIYCIPGGSAGSYLIYNLHRNPHFHLQPSMRTVVKKKAKERNVPFITIGDCSFEKENVIYHDTEQSSYYKDNISPIVEKMDLQAIICRLSKNEINKRGNIAINFGWSNHNYVPKDGINLPRNDLLSDFDRTIIQLMTKAYKNMYASRIVDAPFTTDPERTKRYANLLALVDSTIVGNKVSNLNVFESITYAMTYCGDDDKSQLKIHIDSLNCYEKGFNAVFGMYFILRHPQEKCRYVRLVLLGYSRRSIHNSQIRLEKRNLFKKQILSYISLLRERNNFSLSNAFLYTKSREDHQLIKKLPFVDKCGFYSIFVHAINEVIKNANRKIFLEDVIEMVLPIGWIGTGSNYYLLLMDWIQQGVPTNNLTIFIVEALVKRFGGLSHGVGLRMQPFCNVPIPITKIYHGLHVMKNLIKNLNKRSACDIENAMKELEGIHFIGSLGAQHILCVLTLLRVIINPYYVRSTILLKNNTTFKKISELFNMNVKLVNSLYDEIAMEHFSGSVRHVENLVCEFFRDIKDPLKPIDIDVYNRSIQKRNFRYPDVFYTTQAIYIEEFHQIYKYSYDDNGVEKKEVMSVPELDEDVNRSWFKNYESLMNSTLGTIAVSSRNKGERIKTKSSTNRSLLARSTKSMKKKDHEGIQKEILKMIIEKEADWFNKPKIDINDMSWFEGDVKTMNSNIILLQIVQPNRKRKRKRKDGKERNENIIEHKLSSGKIVYTAHLKGSTSHIFLDSSDELIYQFGLFHFFHKYMYQRHHSLVFYETTKDALMAMKIKIFCGSKYNCLSNGDLAPSLHNLKNNAHMAVFDNSEAHTQFFGFFTKKRNVMHLHVPLSLDNQFQSHWQSFYFSF